MIEIGKTLKCIITNIQMTHNKVFLDCIKKRNLDNNETMNQDNNGKIWIKIAENNVIWKKLNNKAAKWLKCKVVLGKMETEW